MSDARYFAALVVVLGVVLGVGYKINQAHERAERERRVLKAVREAVRERGWLQLLEAPPDAWERQPIHLIRVPDDWLEPARPRVHDNRCESEWVWAEPPACSERMRSW